MKSTRPTGGPGVPVEMLPLVPGVLRAKDVRSTTRPSITGNWTSHPGPPLEHLTALAVRHLPQRLSTGGAAERQTPAAAHHLAVAGERVVTPDRCTTREPGRRPPVQCEAAEETGRPVLALGKELVPGVAQLERVRHRTEVAGPAHHAVAAQAALELDEPGRERVVQLLVEPAGHTTREVRRRLGVGPLHPAGERSTQGLADRSSDRSRAASPSPDPAGTHPRSRTEPSRCRRTRSTRRPVVRPVAKDVVRGCV